MKNFFNNKSILITGGTGSFGKKCIEKIFSSFKPKKVIVFSRDELKQFEMSKKYPENSYPIRYFIGDVRDKERLYRACSKVDYIIHAAAMKRVTASEYNPNECISTNIVGAQNLIDAAIDNNVKKVIALSTDKAANPVNLYGATKLCSDKLFVSANNLVGTKSTRFSIVRYGNVLGSRGSVVPLFKDLIKKGRKKLPITNIKMTRFIITLEYGVNFVLENLTQSSGGEIFVAKIPSIKIVDLVESLYKKNAFEIVGVRPGEKLHEIMIPQEESRNCIEMKDKYIITPQLSWWNRKDLDRKIKANGKKVPVNFEYTSDKNDKWLDVVKLKKLLNKI
ncbi:MAG: UDP-N-acetylglucosamine 4,6-dehydratase (inverting) [Alphaproteobacteria bacterium MarineAlpha9_Bin4]|nr:UDP-N-acetylglucosamine 4,6-dehydratase (inverting) [Pelagibacterales bacterium]PPR25556.1 MAG: UDP-N-acetylglucosamine 4,6-dehydratase (inverting) [Alphaproteobacteria bacterium MarineAlpha9_Bin4]|tara:strand:- start:151 stop:1155 length:1005 start_codon:yes stop_codon:yes gene_type:complete